MSEAWKDFLRNLPNRVKEVECKKPSLRYGLRYLPSSVIGKQYYCEQKVALSYEIGEVETEAMVEGRKAHEEAHEGGEWLSSKEVISNISSGEAYWSHEFPILGESEGVPYFGLLDDLFFYGSNPILVADLRETGREYLWHGRSKEVQLESYCLALDQIGFDCSDLEWMVGVERKGARVSSKSSYYRKHLENIYEELQVLGKISEETRKWNVKGIYKPYFRKYSRNDAEGDIKWAMEFWLEEREAVPTKHLKKCKACDSQNNCSKKPK